MRNIQTYILLLAAVVITAVVFFQPYAMAHNVTLVCDIWPPYQIETEDGVTGASVEIVEAVYKRLGITDITFKAFPWKRAMDAVRFADADALFSANQTSDRGIFLLYPEEPIFKSPWMIWTRSDSSIRTLNDLKGKTVGVVLGYSYTQEFWNFINAYCDVEAVHNDNINFTKLGLGRLDATVAEFGNGLNLLRVLGEEGIRPVPGIEIKRDGLFIAFSRKRTTKEFVERFSYELRAFKHTNEYRKIREKYFGTGN